ncbi:MAG: hypothetical protein Q8L48_12520 [Archangium sp.]|nr:hypothetical protein [Archangium sp.]
MASINRTGSNAAYRPAVSTAARSVARPPPPRPASTLRPRDAFVPSTGLRGVAKASQVTPVKESGPVTETQVIDALKAGKTDDATRTMIGDYFKAQDMAGSHATMEKIRQEGLLDTFIQATVRDENGKPPGAELTAGLTRCMETGRLDVYAETLATTSISVGDYEGKLEYRPSDNAVVLDQNALGDTQNLANILAHELFHAFNDAHGGGSGAINEGFGIAAREYAFTDGEYNLAEMVYGTKNFYRDFNAQPDYPLGDMRNADPKLKEFLDAMGGRDSSLLAWENPAQLEREYQENFEGINRAQDWDTWLVAVGEATTKMLDARGEDRIPKPEEPAPAPAAPEAPKNPIQNFFDWLRKLIGG